MLIHNSKCRPASVGSDRLGLQKNRRDVRFRILHQHSSAVYVQAWPFKSRVPWGHLRWVGVDYINIAVGIGRDISRDTAKDACRALHTLVSDDNELCVESLRFAG